MIGELASGLSVIDFFAKWLNKLPFRKHEPKETIATRFFQLFEAHGVHPNQIPTLIGHGLKIADVQSEEALLLKLDEELLNDVCELFAVRREWLDGADEQIYPLYDFYKWPELFGEFLDKLLVNKSGYEVTGVVLAVKKPKWPDGALIIIEEPIGQIGDRPVYRYHLCNNWMFGYWKARAYLTGCVALAWKKNVCLMGRYVEQAEVEKYQQGLNFLEYGIDSALPLKGIHWYPEDMAVKPEAFLDGIDEGDFGKASALNLWLVEDDKGLMDLGRGYVSQRPAFEQNLEEIQINNGKFWLTVNRAQRWVYNQKSVSILM